MTQIFETYLLALAKTYAGGEGTEHSGRGALETMLKAVAGAGDPKLQVQHEMGQGCARLSGREGGSSPFRCT